MPVLIAGKNVGWYCVIEKYKTFVVVPVVLYKCWASIMVQRILIGIKG